MALATQHFDLYIIPNTTPPPVLDISQYDTSRTFIGHVKDIHGKPHILPNGTTALLEGRNGNKVIFRLNVTVNGDTLTFTPDDILTDAPGRVHATISLDSTGQYLSPLRIIFNIQRAGITKEERTTNPDFKDAVAAAFQAYIDEHGSGDSSGGSGEMNVQSDWNQTNINSDAYIKNKPTKLSDFINDENFITEEDLPDEINFPYITPEDYGAVGDGVTDDTLAIQAAFDAASNGGTVKFGLKKTYMVSRRDDDVRRVYASDSSGQPTPTKIKYMLRISGSMTILGQGSTITYKYPIKKSEYDTEQGEPGSYRRMYTDEAKSAVMLFLDNSTRNQGSNDEVNERNYVTIKGLVLDGAWERRIDDIQDPNNPFVRNLGTHGGGAGANWKGICAHGVRGMVLELHSVTVKEFAGEGVYGTYNPGSKVRAFGCTFTNCMPSAFNIAGTFVEAIGCIFNQTEDETAGSEIAGDKNLFDSCTFNIENGFQAIVYGHDSQELIVRNCIFNRSSYKRPISEVGERMFINMKNASNVLIDSCIFNDEHGDNHQEPLVTMRSYTVGKISNCVFKRSAMAANKTMFVLMAKDSVSNIVRVDSFPEDGAAIVGRGLSIYLSGLSRYKFTKISAPKSITLVPANDCNFTSYGFGTRIINVNKPAYAHTRISIPVDYFSLGSAPVYDSTYIALNNFFVECDGVFSLIVET